MHLPTGRRTTPIVADVNNKQDLARVEAKLKDDPSITMLVNNAGCASVAKNTQEAGKRL